MSSPSSFGSNPWCRRDVLGQPGVHIGIGLLSEPVVVAVALVRRVDARTLLGCLPLGSARGRASSELVGHAPARCGGIGRLGSQATRRRLLFRSACRRRGAFGVLYSVVVLRLVVVRVGWLLRGVPGDHGLLASRVWRLRSLVGGWGWSERIWIRRSSESGSVFACASDRGFRIRA